MCLYRAVCAINHEDAVQWPHCTHQRVRAPIRALSWTGVHRARIHNAVIVQSRGEYHLHQEINLRVQLLDCTSWQRIHAHTPHYHYRFHERSNGILLFHKENRRKLWTVSIYRIRSCIANHCLHSVSFISLSATTWLSALCVEEDTNIQPFANRREDERRKM